MKFAKSLYSTDVVFGAGEGGGEVLTGEGELFKDAEVVMEGGRTASKAEVGLWRGESGGLMGGGDASLARGV